MNMLNKYKHELWLCASISTTKEEVFLCMCEKYVKKVWFSSFFLSSFSSYFLFYFLFSSSVLFILFPPSSSLRSHSSFNNCLHVSSLFCPPIVHVSPLSRFLLPPSLFLFPFLFPLFPYTIQTKYNLTFLFFFLLLLLLLSPHPFLSFSPPSMQSTYIVLTLCYCKRHLGSPCRQLRQHNANMYSHSTNTNRFAKWPQKSLLRTDRRMDGWTDGRTD